MQLLEKLKKVDCYRMTKRKVKKRIKYHDKIRIKEDKIKNSDNTVDFSDDKIKEVMARYGYTDYRIEVWGDVSLKSKYDSWKISTDKKEKVVYLHHANERLIRKGNNRSSWHLQNVFYDLDFCVKSIHSHDKYKERAIKNKNSPT